MRIAISIYSDKDELLESGGALNFESAYELLGKMERRAVPEKDENFEEEEEEEEEENDNDNFSCISPKEGFAY